MVQQLQMNVLVNMRGALSGDNLENYVADKRLPRKSLLYPPAKETSDHDWPEIAGKVARAETPGQK